MKTYLFPSVETAKVYQCLKELEFGKEARELIQSIAGKQSEQEDP